MELRQYWQVLVDRAAVVIATFLAALVVAAASVYLIPEVATPYQATLIISVDPRSEPAGSYYTYDGYYAYLSSEYLNDDLINFLESNDFMQTVRNRLKDFPGGPPSGSILGEKAHRVVHLTISSPTSAGALAIAHAVEQILTSPESNAAVFGALIPGPSPKVTVINQPEIVAGPAGRSALLNLAVRALVGLALGIGLAFLLEYLDDTVRPGEIGALVGLPVVGEIPGRGVPTPRKK